MFCALRFKEQRQQNFHYMLSVFLVIPKLESMFSSVSGFQKLKELELIITF